MTARLLTHVELRSTAFPALPDEDERINPGSFGQRLTEFLRDKLAEVGEKPGEPIAEDWGWVLPILGEDFNLWVGGGNYGEYEDGFLCFIEPHKPAVRRWFRRIPTVASVERLQRNLDSVLRADARIRDIKWSTYEEFSSV